MPITNFPHKSYKKSSQYMMQQNANFYRNLLNNS